VGTFSWPRTLSAGVTVGSRPIVGAVTGVGAAADVFEAMDGDAPEQPVKTIRASKAETAWRTGTRPRRPRSVAMK
jgi:hypothetical protein